MHGVFVGATESISDVPSFRVAVVECELYLAEMR
jgi:hypothetical protein